MAIEDARKYAEKYGVKFVKHRNGEITVSHKIRGRRGTNSESLRKRLLRPIRGIQKRLSEDGYEYIPNPKNFTGTFPDKKAKVTFRRKKQ